MSGENGEKNESITIKIRDQAGDQIFFKVKQTTKMSKIIGAYAKRRGLSKDNLRFLVDGERVKEEETVKTLELDDGDQLDVVLQQVGGSF